MTHSNPHPTLHLLRDVLRRLGAVFFSLTFVMSGCATDEEADSQSVCEGAKCDETLDEGDFEFIIVGSGAGGGPLAANLARNNHSVLLLEAGSDPGANVNYQVPAYHAFSTEEPDMRWDYFVDHYDDPDKALRDSKMVFDQDGNPEGILYPRAGALGGCTTHNAMIMIRPHRSDWDDIARLTGDSSWSAERMDPYFDRVMAWLDTEMADPDLALFDFSLQKVILGGVMAFVDATGQGIFGQLGSNFSELKALLGRDINAERPENEGIYPFPLAMEDGKRRSVREYLLETVDEGFPLTIRTGSFVTNVAFDEASVAEGRPRAIGVDFVAQEHMYAADPNADLSTPLPEPTRVTASREVIVAAGAFNTPQILQLSGIGPRELLEEHDIDPVVELPGVGTNLQDRYEVGLVSENRSDFKILQDCTFGEDSSDPCFEEWERGEGPYRSNGGAVTIVKRSSRDLPDPDLFIFGVPGEFAGYEPGYSDAARQNKDRFTWLILKGHTRNRAGSVQIRSADPRVRPDIDFRYFEEGDTNEGQDAHDLQAMVTGVALVRQMERKTRKLMLAPLFGRFDELWPGPEVDTADEVAQWVRDEAWGHHASCSAPIGAQDDPMAVLDSRFRVRGVDGLRVVDASVFPEIPGFFIVLPIFMVSEKATDVILEDLGEIRIEENQP